MTAYDTVYHRNNYHLWQLFGKRLINTVSLHPFCENNSLWHIELLFRVLFHTKGLVATDE